VTGAEGAKGVTGGEGAKGVTGGEGAKGVTGGEGAKGTTGNEGKTGPTGATGLSALSGTSGSIGGSSLGSDACTPGTVTVTGATTSMVAVTAPNTYPGEGVSWSAQVTSANAVTVRVCNTTNQAKTPIASTYNVRVIQ
jgi:hypothetical protein